MRSVQVFTLTIIGELKVRYSPSRTSVDNQPAEALSWSSNLGALSIAGDFEMVSNYDGQSNQSRDPEIESAS